MQTLILAQERTAHLANHAFHKFKEAELWIQKAQGRVDLIGIQPLGIITVNIYIRLPCVLYFVNSFNLYDNPVI